MRRRSTHSHYCVCVCVFVIASMNIQSVCLQEPDCQLIREKTNDGGRKERRREREEKRARERVKKEIY